MKLEYVPDGSVDAPLIRLYDFSLADAGRLRKEFAHLAAKSILSLELHNAEFIDALDACQLTLMVNRWDQGVIKTGEPATFRCGLTAGRWDNVAGLTEPFTRDGSSGYQWLNSTGIPLLLSHDGFW